MSKMRVVQVTRPKGALELIEREIPEPGVGSVCIKVEACGVCHADSITKEGTSPGIQYPRVPGHEIAGIIDAVGIGVVGWTLANGSESAGTADTAGTAIPAVAVISLPAKSRPKFPVSRTTVGMLNT